MEANYELKATKSKRRASQSGSRVISKTSKISYITTKNEGRATTQTYSIYELTEEKTSSSA